MSVPSSGDHYSSDPVQVQSQFSGAWRNAEHALACAGGWAAIENVAAVVLVLAMVVAARASMVALVLVLVVRAETALQTANEHVHTTKACIR